MLLSKVFYIRLTITINIISEIILALILNNNVVLIAWKYCSYVETESSIFERLWRHTCSTCTFVFVLVPEKNHLTYYVNLLLFRLNHLADLLKWSCFLCLCSTRAQIIKFDHLSKHMKSANLAISKGAGGYSFTQALSPSHIQATTYLLLLCAINSIL